MAVQDFKRNYPESVWSKETRTHTYSDDPDSTLPLETNRQTIYWRLLVHLRIYSYKSSHLSLELRGFSIGTCSNTTCSWWVCLISPITSDAEWIVTITIWRWFHFDGEIFFPSRSNSSLCDYPTHFPFIVHFPNFLIGTLKCDPW